MSEVTLEAIAGLLKQELEPINTKLGAIEETVSGHTSALLELSKDVKEIKEELIIHNRKFEKHQDAIKFTAEKVGIAEPIKKILEA